MTYPLTDPISSGHLMVSDGDRIYWQTSGKADGKPALYLHGGPGSGLGNAGYRRWFDPEQYLVVALDQRGCGRSRPLVIDALDRIQTNTTERLIADIEELREHLGIEQWLVSGASWGSTLALAYAQAHPTRISEIVLYAVTTTSREEVTWITETVGAIFPEAWEAFAKASDRAEGERIVEAYARRMREGDAFDREQAAYDWGLWENTHVSLDPAWEPRPWTTDAKTQVFSTLVSHYWAHDAFLTGDNAILKRMDRIAEIPGVLIHGRRDVSGPAVTAWKLHQQWPASELMIVESDGHGGAQMTETITSVLDRFATRRAEYP